MKIPNFEQIRDNIIELVNRKDTKGILYEKYEYQFQLLERGVAVLYTYNKFGRVAGNWITVFLVENDDLLVFNNYGSWIELLEEELENV